MIVAIMQPTYIPWVGYFNLIEKSDYFVFLDDVQFDKRSWQQRNKILINFEEKFLTIPVFTKKKFFQNLNKVLIDNSRKWKAKHLKTIRHSYGNHPHFAQIFDLLEKIYNEDNNSLVHLNTKIISTISLYLGFNCKFDFSSNFKKNNQKEKRLLDILKQVKAKKYISPIGSKNYIGKGDLFTNEQIEFEYIDYKCKTYSQIKKKKFISNLSILDLLFNHGKESIKYI